MYKQVFAAESRFVLFHLWWIDLLVFLHSKCLCIMCLHCKGLHISLVWSDSVNIPIVELLLSWLSLFHLSSKINDLLPVMRTCVNLERQSHNRASIGDRSLNKCLQVSTAWPIGEAVVQLQVYRRVCFILICLLLETWHVYLWKSNFLVGSCCRSNPEGIGRL